MKRLLFIALVAALAAGAQAGTFDWQGGDGNWGDANWTVDGTADQQALDDQGDDYTDYTDAVFTITDGTISKVDGVDGGLTKLTGASSWTQTGGSVTINETGAWAAGINLAVDGTGGATMSLSGTANLDVTINATGGGAKKAALFINPTGRLTMSGDSTLSLSSLNSNDLGLEIKNDVIVTMKDNANLITKNIRFTTGGSSDTFFNFESGTITITDANPLQTPSLGSGNEPSNRINFKTLNGAGAAQIIHLDNTGTTLLSKMGTGFFCIDGVIVNDLSTVVNGYKFDIVTDGTTDTLSLVVPEPTTMVLLGLGGLIALRKRK